MCTIYKISCLFLIVFNIVSCSQESDIQSDEILIIETPDTSLKPNILLIIADDMGVDASPNYNIGVEKPIMPTLENLTTTGITFNNVWSNPTCTPTRSTLLTGKYGFRTNVMKVDDVLSTSEISIQKYLDNNLGNEYNHAVIGKWHLSNNTSHPTNMGINYYAGSLGGGLKNYWDWTFLENNQSTSSNEYTTTKYTDLAIDWIEDQTKPWFLWLAYNAPHEPFHLPPTNLHSRGNLPNDNASIEANPLPYYLAMLEAMDTEIGRLLSSMTSEERGNTVIIFIGDNGTPNKVVQTYNSRRAKGSLYQGGINVPLIISGKNVDRIHETENALINVTDLYATIANIAGVEVSKINDSYSFNNLLSTSGESIREYIYSEAGDHTNSADVTIRNYTHKYILFENGDEALFDLSADPLESKNLLHARNLPLNEQNNLMKETLIAALQQLKK